MPVRSDNAVRSLGSISTEVSLFDSAVFDLSRFSDVGVRVAIRPFDAGLFDSAKFDSAVFGPSWSVPTLRSDP